MTAKTMLGMPALFVLVLCLALTACTGSNLRGSSTGWSPAAAIPVPDDTGAFLNEGNILSSFDDTLTVTESTGFAVDQVLQIDREQMRVIAIDGRDLIVVRGFNDTRPESHEDRARISRPGGRTIVIIVSKEGNFIALDDSGRPSTDLWTYTIPERKN